MSGNNLADVHWGETDAPPHYVGASQMADAERGSRWQRDFQPFIRVSAQPVFPNIKIGEFQTTG